MMIISSTVKTEQVSTTPSVTFPLVFLTLLIANQELIWSLYWMLSEYGSMSFPQFPFGLYKLTDCFHNLLHLSQLNCCHFFFLKNCPYWEEITTFNIKLQVDFTLFFSWFVSCGSFRLLNMVTAKFYPNLAVFNENLDNLDSWGFIEKISSVLFRKVGLKDLHIKINFHSRQGAFSLITFNRTEITHTNTHTVILRVTIM